MGWSENRRDVCRKFQDICEIMQSSAITESILTIVDSFLVRFECECLELFTRKSFFPRFAYCSTLKLDVLYNLKFV